MMDGRRRICICATILLFVIAFDVCCVRALSIYREPVEKKDEDRSLLEELRTLKRLLDRDEVQRELETARREEFLENAQREKLLENAQRQELLEIAIREEQLEDARRELMRREELQREERAKTVHAHAFLEKYGYLPTIPANKSHDPATTKSAIKKMQRMYHLNQTGVLDEITLRMMQAPRCGMPDAVPKEYAANKFFTGLTANNYYVPGYKWRKSHLTWKLKNYHQSLSQGVTKNAFYQAFKYWSDVSGLTFAETQSKADINLQFVWGSHGDGPENAFDGPNGVLAHAFYPESGETHFDSEEPWTDGVSRGINLKIVAAHELGHTIGLGHSEVQGALMAPYYQGYEPNFKLHSDDIRAVQSLYGSARPADSPTNPQPGPYSTSTITTTTESSRTNTPGATPNTCNLVYKAVTQTHDYRVYVYQGKWMWRMSEYGLDQGFPLTISTYYENPPESISAAIFSWKTYYTYFFKGKKLWRYYGFQLVDTKTSQDQSYPDNPKTAIASKDGVIYLVKDGSLYKFDENSLDVVGASNPIPFNSVFPGAPSSFDSMLRLANDPHIYFFQGQNYHKYSEDSRQVLSGYPKLTAATWMGGACGGRPNTPK